ncbi:MAG: hypothetical protein RBT55_15265 [Rhodocyclaceae bacterium]|jgi:hypothetical protein|nr:hypothetical protein [Rhodocyclaceae bacterium]
MSLSDIDRVKQRRRLLKTVIGAPAIFTLPSGMALANSSSGACLQDGSSVVNVTDEEAFFESMGGSVADGATVTLPPAAGFDGGDYVYDASNDRLVSASCWNSVGVGNLAARALSRIV